MTLPTYIIGTPIHYYTNGDCVAGVLTYKDSASTATLDISRADMARDRSPAVMPLSSLGDRMDKVTLVGAVKAAPTGFEGWASTSQLDRQGDIVLPSAFEASLPAFKSNGPIFWNHAEVHDPLAKPIGRAVDAEIRSGGLYLKARWASHEEAQVVRSLVTDGIVSTLSIGFNPIHSEIRGGVNVIDQLELMEVSVVAIPANVGAVITASKTLAEMTPEEIRTAWSSAYITALPDSAFACVQGKNRYYPHHNASGAVDKPHLRAALSRIGDPSNQQCGKAHLEAHAKTVLQGNSITPHERKSDDVTLGSQCLAMLSELKDGEDPDDAAILQRAIDALLEWLGSEASEGPETDDILNEQEGMSAEEDRAPVMMSHRVLTYRSKA